MIINQLNNIPKLYEQENNPNPTLYARYFIEATGWEWYVMEYSPLQKLCFGYVIGDESELGYFSLDELESIEYKYGVSVEFDSNFIPITLQELKSERCA